MEVYLGSQGKSDQIDIHVTCSTKTKGCAYLNYMF
jgi:hypothetical protein